jgi:Flp pilus assembly protein protease CpaA
MDATWSLASEHRRRLWTVALVGPALLLPLFFLPLPQGTRAALTFGQALALVLTAVAAVTDLKVAKIFNWCTYPAVAWGLAIALAGAAEPRIGQALGSLSPGACLLGLAVCLALMAVLHDLTGGGMGDVKLAAALGCLVGLGTALPALLLSFALAGVSELALGVVRYGPVPTFAAYLKTYLRWFLPTAFQPTPGPGERALLERRVRLGPYFALGTILTFVLAGSGWL